MLTEKAVFCAGTYTRDLILSTNRLIIQKLPAGRTIAHIIFFPLTLLGGYSGCFSMEITADDGKQKIENTGFFGPAKSIEKVIAESRITRTLNYDEITKVTIGMSAGNFEILIESKGD